MFTVVGWSINPSRLLLLFHCFHTFSSPCHFLSYSNFDSTSIMYSFMGSTLVLVVNLALILLVRLWNIIHPCLSLSLLLLSVQLFSEESLWARGRAVPFRRLSGPVRESHCVPRQHRCVRAQRTCKFTRTHFRIEHTRTHAQCRTPSLSTTTCTHWNEKSSPIYIFTTHVQRQKIWNDPT